MPRNVPFAAAPTDSWVNSTVAGQVVLSGFYAAGSIGIVVAQLAAVVVALGVVAGAAMSRGAAPRATAAVLGLVAIGAAAPLLIGRAQLLSLVPFALLLALVRGQQVRQSAAIWCAVPILAVWGNLHGAVLVGVAILGCFLAFTLLRRAPMTAVGVGFGSLLATCLNPGLTRAPHYYLGVFGGAATSDDSGMWSGITPSNPFDVLLVAAAIALLLMAFRRARPTWEHAAALGLGFATLIAARNGVWLLLFLAEPAILGVSRSATARPVGARGAVRGTIAAVVLSVLVGTVLLGTRLSSFRDADREASDLAHATRGCVVLVAEPLAESLAAAGATVWASNPLDAFTQADQTAYLAFMNGDSPAAQLALQRSDLVVALPGSKQERLARQGGFTQSTTHGAYLLLRRP
ncbi:hypothetical protein [Terrabacter sp. 2YAF2]|uniref:hypothetical protein n=1 Tax=Terrabacter sp. 2YAF2 TaxID=3233026 RepID=UPI003F98F366